MNPRTKKSTFTLPIELVIFLQSKENQTAFVTDAIKKAKTEEEKNAIKAAAQEMQECTKLWDELKDWDITLEDGIDD